MRHKRRFARLLFIAEMSMLVLVLGHSCTLFAGSTKLTAGEPNDLRWDLAEAFAFNWNSAEVSAKASNPALDSEPSAQATVRTIAVSAGVHFDPLKANGLVIIDVNRPQVYEVIDADGLIVECRSVHSDIVRGYQHFGWGWDREGRPTANGLEPFSITVHLAGDAKQPIPSSISRLHGYIYALYADDIIRIDLPFDPNSGWLDAEAAPDLTLLVDPTTPPPPAPLQYVSTLPNVPPGFEFEHPHAIPSRPTAAIACYSYTTWVKAKTDQRVLGLLGLRYPRSSYAFGDYAVLRTELYDSQRNIAAVFKEQHVVGTFFFGRYGACCSGMSLQGDGNTYDTIRHIIAVHPVEVKIPFILRNIHLPSVKPGEGWDRSVFQDRWDI